MSDQTRPTASTSFQPLPITIFAGRIPDVHPRPGPENPQDPSGRMQLIISGLVAQVEQQSAQIAELQKAVVQLQQHAAQAEQRFATHTHPCDYPALGYENIQVMINPGKWDFATVIRKWTISTRESAPPSAPK